jgi:hypothetical protein
MEKAMVSPLIAAVPRRRGAVPVWVTAGVQVLLGLEVVMCLARVGFEVVSSDMWRRIAAGQDFGADSSVGRVLAPLSTGTADTWLFLATAAAFITWLYLAYRVAQELSPSQLTARAGLAIGCWFIPVGNLWMPYQSVRDVWQASVPPGAEREGVARSRLVLSWWLLFVVVRLANLASRGLTAELVSAPGAESDLYLAFAVRSMLEATAAVLAVLVVRRVARMQDVFLLSGPRPGAGP